MMPEITTNFSLFPSLPKELRLKVWEYTIEPQTVILVDIYEPATAMENFRPVSPVPIIFHVNRESRTTAEEFYAKAFKSGDRYAYVNFEIDTISVPDCCIEEIIPEERVRIRWVRVEGVDEDFFVETTVKDYLTTMVDLEELTIVQYEQFREFNSWFYADGQSGGWVYVRRELENVLGHRAGWKCPESGWELGRSCLPL